MRAGNAKLMRSFNTNLGKTGISRRHVYFQFLLPFLPLLLFLLRRGLDFHSAVLPKTKPWKVHLDMLLQVVASVKLGLNTKPRQRAASVF